MQRAVRKVAPFVAMAAAASALAACGGTESDAITIGCPDVVLVAETSKLIRFGGAVATPDEVAVRGEIVEVLVDCDYSDEDVFVETALTMVFDRNTGMAADSQAIQFYVAVARPDQTIIGKQVFDQTVSFDDGENRIGLREVVGETIPLPGGVDSGRGYTVYVGFQLSSDELQYNRLGGG